jgi:hypothetical protein
MFNSGLLTSKTYEWETPQEFFDKLNKEYHFDLDPCATIENAKRKHFFTLIFDEFSVIAMLLVSLIVTYYAFDISFHNATFVIFPSGV